jgi:hypothetical protein
MAEDVVPKRGGNPLPPPSTAASIEAETAKPVERLTRPERARRTAYRVRFILFYFGLALVAGSAIGALVVVLSRPSAKPAPAWSTWRPDGKSASARVLQIADRVPKGYRLQNGDPLVLAHASPPSISTPIGDQQVDLPISQITLLPALDTVSASRSLQISFCSAGKDCPLALTVPSARLLRRETLELALYTFKYVDTIDSITFLLPPTNPQTAIFLQRSDLKKELSQPLARSLAEKPPKAGGIPAAELQVINHATRTRLYHFDVTQEAGGRVVEVLTPVPPPKRS